MSWGHIPSESLHHLSDDLQVGSLMVTFFFLFVCILQILSLYCFLFNSSEIHITYT